MARPASAPLSSSRYLIRHRDGRHWARMAGDGAGPDADHRRVGDVLGFTDLE